jgi:hypothetical protein
VPRGLWPMRLADLWKGITSDPELGFERGDSGWRDIDEKNVIETPEGGFD